MPLPLLGQPNDLRLDTLGVPARLARHQETPRALRRQVNELGGKGHIDPPSYAKKRSYDATVRMMRDPVVRKGFELRQHMVAGTDVYFSARDRKGKILVEFYDELLDLSDNFDEARLNLTRSVLEGMSWLRMLTPSVDSRFRIASDETPRKWWYPAYFQHFDSDHVRLDYYDGEPQENEDGHRHKPRAFRWAYYDANQRTWFQLPMDPAAPEWLSVRYHDWNYTMGYGDGLLDSIFFFWESKARIMRSLLEGLDRFGWPFLIGKLRAGAGTTAVAGAPMSKGQDRAQALLTQFNRSRGNQKAIVVDEGDSIEAMSVDGAAVQHMLSTIEYLDTKIVECILASSMPTGGGQQGSFARAAVEAGSTSSLIKYDRKLHERALRQIVRAVHVYNEENWRAILDTRPRYAGTPLWAYKMPKIHIGREETDDPSQQLEIAERAAALGLPLLRQEVYERIGYTQPDEDDETIGGMAEMPTDPSMVGDPSMAAPMPGGNQQRDPMAGTGDGVVMSEVPATAKRAADGLDSSLGSLHHLRANGTVGDDAMRYFRDHGYLLREGA